MKKFVLGIMVLGSFSSFASGKLSCHIEVNDTKKEFNQELESDGFGVIEPSSEEDGIKGIFLQAISDDFKLAQVVITDINTAEQFREQPFSTSYSKTYLKGVMNISADTEVYCEVINVD